MVGTMASARDETRSSVSRLIARGARRFPDRIAIADDEAQISYAELHDRVNQVAVALRHLGLRQGDVAGLLVGNRIELLVVAAAVCRLGGVASMLNTTLRGDPLLHCLGAAPPRILVVGQELAELRTVVEPWCAEVGCTTAWVGSGAPTGWVDLMARADQAPSTTVHEVSRMGDPAFLVFTSGTTGMPKASRMSHRRWIGAGFMFGGVCLRLRPRDVLYCPLPLYHNTALTLCWSSTLRAGATLAVRQQFSASAFWDDCRRHGATVITYVGEIPNYLAGLPPTPADRDHSVRKMVGIGLHPHRWHAFKERFGIEEVYEFYSASELNAGFFNILNLDQTVGFCLSPWELVAYDAETAQPLRGEDGRVVRAERGREGLLLTRVTDRFKFEGYTDAAASERKLVRDAFSPGDCWVNTGDVMRSIGFGHAQFVDRIGDTFRWKSENVSTAQVEAVLAASPGVADAAVYGVEVPHTHGRAGMAAVVPAGDTLDLDALLAHLRNELPSPAVPLFVRILDRLDTTATFKHVKRGLRADGFRTQGVYIALGTSFVPLTDELLEGIDAGSIRL